MGCPLQSAQHDFENVVSFFRSAFVIVFSLALTEALKQFVNDKQPDGTNPTRHIHRDRFPALLAFLFLIVPFFHGTVRYFYLHYESQPAFADYASNLVVDGVFFLGEAAIFFAMSRAIALVRWRDLYNCIFVLMCVDTLWSYIALQRGTQTQNWMELNIGLAVLLAGVLVFTHSGKAKWLPSLLCLLFVAIRTYLDYRWNWSMYFPSVVS